MAAVAAGGLYCDSFIQQAEDATKDLPGGVPTDLADLPDIKLSASVGEVTQHGDTADAAGHPPDRVDLATN